MEHKILQNGSNWPEKLKVFSDLMTELEAYRIITVFYAWIKASEQQVWQQIQSIDYKNPVNDFHKLKAQIEFAIENLRFVGCEHPLLQRFCPAGKCFIAELSEQLEKPYLFK